MPIFPFPRIVARSLLVGLVAVAALSLAGCDNLHEVRREVRKVFEGTQEPSPPPGPAPVQAPSSQQARPAAAPAAPSPATPSGAVASLPAAPSTGAVPGPGAAAGSPPAGPLDVRLTPPTGVVPLVRIAVLLPLSGPEAKLGQALLNAAQLALFSIADESFTLLPFDTRGTPEGAAAAARRAVDDGARLVLGPVFSASVAAAAPITRAAGIQMVSFSNDRAVAGNGVYIMGFTPETQIGRITGYAAARGVRRIAAVVPAGAFGERVLASLTAAATANGVSVGRIVRYEAADTQTLSPLIRRLANYDARRSTLLDRRRELEGKTDEASQRALRRLENLETLGDVDFDAVLMPEGGAALRALAPLLPFYDIDPRKVHMIGSAQWDDPAVATEPSLFGGWFPAPSPEARRAFEDVYNKTYGEAPPRLAALAYDATALAAVLVRARAEASRVAAAAARGAPPPPVAAANPFTAEALTAPNGFSGVDGIFRLLPSGLAERGLAVIEVRSRRFAVVSPAPTTFQKPGN